MMTRVSLARTFFLLSLVFFLSRGSSLVRWESGLPLSDSKDILAIAGEEDQATIGSSSGTSGGGGGGAPPIRIPVGWDWEVTAANAPYGGAANEQVSYGRSYRRWTTLDPVTTTEATGDHAEPSSLSSSSSSFAVSSPSVSSATSHADPALDSHRILRPPPSMETQLVFQPQQESSGKFDTTASGEFHPAAGEPQAGEPQARRSSSFQSHLPSHPPPSSHPLLSPHSPPSSSSSPSFESLRQMALRSPQPNISLAYLQNLMESQDVASTAFRISPQQAKPMLRARDFDARLDLGDNPVGDSRDSAITFWDDLMQLTSEVSPVYANTQLPKVPEAKLRQMQFFASVSAVAYCMSWNVYPQWKCGYPRCSHPTLGAFNQSGEQDVLASTESMLYFKGQQSGMVGFVALNDQMDMGYSTGDLADQEWHHSVIMVAFRGTMNIKNFMFDLRFAQVAFQYPGAPKTARVHSGFWEIWKDCEALVKDGLRKAVDLTLARQQGRKVHLEIVMSGHSLGGAVALLGALGLRQDIMEHKWFPGVGRSMSRYDLIRLGKDELERSLVFWFGDNLCVSFKLYTFGEPRVGNSVFAKWLVGLG